MAVLKAATLSLEEIMAGLKKVNPELTEELKTSSEVLLPLLREYLRDVRSVRMAFASEVKEILLSSRELTNVAKTAEELRDFGKACLLIKEILTPEFLEVLKRLSK